MLRTTAISIADNTQYKQKLMERNNLYQALKNFGRYDAAQQQQRFYQTHMNPDDC
jgi:hypothetical protein